MNNTFKMIAIMMMITGMIMGLGAVAGACENIHSGSDVIVIESSDSDAGEMAEGCEMSACSSAIETAERNCPKCDGCGRCHMCGGSGKYNDHTCNTCNGSGRCFYCNGDGDLWN